MQVWEMCVWLYAVYVNTVNVLKENWKKQTIRTSQFFHLLWHLCVTSIQGSPQGPGYQWGFLPQDCQNGQHHQEWTPEAGILRLSPDILERKNTTYEITYSQHALPTQVEKKHCYMYTWEGTEWILRILNTVNPKSNIFQALQSQHALQYMVDVVQVVALKLEVFKLIFWPMKTQQPCGKQTLSWRRGLLITAHSLL